MITTLLKHWIYDFCIEHAFELIDYNFSEVPESDMQIYYDYAKELTRRSINDIVTAYNITLFNTLIDRYQSHNHIYLKFEIHRTYTHLYRDMG